MREEGRAASGASARERESDRERERERGRGKKKERKQGGLELSSQRLISSGTARLGGYNFFAQL